MSPTVLQWGLAVFTDSGEDLSVFDMISPHFCSGSTAPLCAAVGALNSE